MEVLIFVMLLYLLQIFVYALTIHIDVYFKYKKYKTIKKPFFIVKSKYYEEKTVSLVSFYHQIFNFIYIVFYLSIAIIYSFFHKNIWLVDINIFSAIVYFIATFVALVIFWILCLVKIEQKPVN